MGDPREAIPMNISIWVFWAVRAIQPMFYNELGFLAPCSLRRPSSGFSGDGILLFSPVAERLGVWLDQLNAG